MRLTLTQVRHGYTEQGTSYPNISKKILIVLILIFSECAVNGRSSQLIDTDFISLGTFIHSFTDSFIHMPNQFA